MQILLIFIFKNNLLKKMKMCIVPMTSQFKCFLREMCGFPIPFLEVLNMAEQAIAAYQVEESGPALEVGRQVDAEYSQVRVPIKARRRLIQPMSVWFGYAFGPVAIVSAATVAASFSFRQTLFVTLVGCILLILISGAMGWIGQREGMTFSLISRFAWGSEAYKIAALIIPIGLVGWSSIHIFTTSMFVNRIFTGQTEFTWVYYVSCIVCVLLFGGSAVKGMNTVTFIGFFAVPFIIILLGVTAYKSMGILGSLSDVFAAAPSKPGSMTTAMGFTAMVGSFACGAGGASPDIQRFCKKPRFSWYVAIVTFGIAYPFLMFCASLMSLATGATQFVDVYAAFNMLPVGGLGVLLLAWSTVNADYYTASLSFAAVTGAKREYATMAIAATGGVLALLGSGYFLEHYLVAMAAFMVPIVGVAAADYLLVNNGKYPEPEIAMTRDSKIPKVKWGALVGYAVGVITLFVSERTSFLVPPINSLVMTMLFHWIGCKIFSKQKSNFNDLIDEEKRQAAFQADTYQEMKAAGLVE